MRHLRPGLSPAEIDSSVPLSKRPALERRYRAELAGRPQREFLRKRKRKAEEVKYLNSPYRPPSRRKNEKAVKVSSDSGEVLLEQIKSVGLNSAECHHCHQHSVPLKEGRSRCPRCDKAAPRLCGCGCGHTIFPTRITMDFEDEDHYQADYEKRKREEKKADEALEVYQRLLYRTGAEERGEWCARWCQCGGSHIRDSDWDGDPTCLKCNGRISGAEHSAGWGEEFFFFDSLMRSNGRPSSYAKRETRYRRAKP